MTRIGYGIAGILMALGASSALAQVNTSTATANSSTTIIKPLTITKNTDLLFGRIVRPSTGSDTVTIANSADTVSTTGGTTGAIALASTTSRAKFTIAGEQGLVTALTVPATLTLTNSATDTLTVTLAPSISTATITLGATDTVLFVGGSFPVTSSTPSGAYSGTFNATVTYQ